MAESVYIATSLQYPGLVKIGRTDRSVVERMSELSASDYGLPGNEGDVDWEVSKVIVVEDNAAAEAALHTHFADSRVSADRELFYADDPEALAREAASVVDGDLLEDLSDPETLDDVLDDFDDLGITLTIGLIAAEALHQRFAGHPRYERALNTASALSERAAHGFSEALELAGQTWSSTELQRSQISSSAKRLAAEVADKSRVRLKALLGEPRKR